MTSRKILTILAVSFLLVAQSALARDTRARYSIADVLENPEYASRLEGVTFYFGDQSHPAIKKDHGEYRTNKKTNAFGKSDLKACQWVMMSALLQLRERALSLGANAVVNVKSNYKNVEVSSETEFECGAGAIIAGVALIGTIADIE